MATLKKTINWFSQWLNAGQKFCRMLQREHSAIFLTFIKLPFVIKIFVLSISEWLFYTGFTVRYLVADSHRSDWFLWSIICFHDKGILDFIFLQC